MRAITLWEPWASLIALGEKQYETRSWSTNYRGLLAIHAAKRKPERFAAANIALSEHGYTKWDPEGSPLPVGCVVAIVRLVDCIPTIGHWHYNLSERERAFGDFSPGRYAWKLKLVERLQPPIPASGSQGFWNWDAGKRENSDLPLFRVQP